MSECFVIEQFIKTFAQQSDYIGLLHQGLQLHTTWCSWRAAHSQQNLLNRQSLHKSEMKWQLKIPHIPCRTI